jgi:predicted alpha/beta hydrolase family esterase
MLLFFDSITRNISGDNYTTSRWEIDFSVKHEKWTANTLTRWLHEVTSEFHERPFEGFRWTSHSLRKGAATTAYIVGVTLQKIKYFSGWLAKSNVVLDYIGPKVLA